MEGNKVVLNVTVNGLNAKECVSKVRSRMDSIQKSAFNIAVLASYAMGKTIPAYDGKAEATIEKKVTPKDFYTAVNRSKSTLSRWVGAMGLIIDNGDFTLFADGILPFNYDKIYLIYSEDTKKFFKDYTKSELFGMSINSLKALMVTDEGEGEGESEDEGEGESEGEGTVTTAEGEGEGDETVTFIYNGNTYECKKSAIEDFVKGCKVI